MEDDRKIRKQLMVFLEDERKIRKQLRGLFGRRKKDKTAAERSGWKIVTSSREKMAKNLTVGVVARRWLNIWKEVDMLEVRLTLSL